MQKQISTYFKNARRSYDHSWWCNDKHSQSHNMTRFYRRHQTVHREHNRKKAEKTPENRRKRRRKPEKNEDVCSPKTAGNWPRSLNAMTDMRETRGKWERADWSLTARANCAGASKFMTGGKLMMEREWRNVSVNWGQHSQQLLKVAMKEDIIFIKDRVLGQWSSYLTCSFPSQMIFSQCRCKCIENN